MDEGIRTRREEYAELLRKSAEEVVKKLRDRVERISIFGSYARGRTDLFTDLDILIVMKTDKPFPERLKELYSLLALPVDVDVLCYTPEEFERMKGTGFLKKVMEEEILLYEKRSD